MTHRIWSICYTSTVCEGGHPRRWRWIIWWKLLWTQASHWGWWFVWSVILVGICSWSRVKSVCFYRILNLPQVRVDLGHMIVLCLKSFFHQFARSYALLPLILAGISIWPNYHPHHNQYHTYEDPSLNQVQIYSHRSTSKFLEVDIHQ